MHTGYEATDDPAVFERSVQAWSSLLASLGVARIVEDKIKAVLAPRRGRRPVEGLDTSLDNPAELAKKLRAAGPPFSQMLS